MRQDESLACFLLWKAWRSCFRKSAKRNRSLCAVVINWLFQWQSLLPHEEEAADELTQDLKNHGVQIAGAKSWYSGASAHFSN